MTLPFRFRCFDECHQHGVPKQIARLITTRPAVLCLRETKLAAFTQQLVIETVGPSLDMHSFLPAEGTRGGILLALAI
jgi:hypothetical protein